MRQIIREEINFLEEEISKLTDDELDQLSDDSDALDTYFGPGGVGHIPRSDFM